MLIAIPVLRSSAVEVIDTRVYSEDGKTRITIQLDGPAQYQTQLTSEPGISISLLKTGLGAIRKITNINDALVDMMTLREIAGSIVDVNITLKKDVNFAIFPLESPERFVIDITPAELPEDTQPLVALTSDPVAEDSNPPDSGAEAGVVADPGADAVEGRIISFLPLKTRDYILAQLILSAVLVTAMIVMGIKLWFMIRASKKNHKILKKSQSLADIINGTDMANVSRQEAERSNNTIGILNNTIPQSITPQKGRGKTKKNRRNAQAASLQEQYRKVYELAQLGMDRLAISQQSKVPIGEVNLILDLSKARPQIGQTRGSA